jgi:hypothetical protein
VLRAEPRAADNFVQLGIDSVEQATLEDLERSVELLLRKLTNKR